MRSVLLILAASALSSCYAGMQQPMTRSAEADARLHTLLAGKVAGPPMSCLPSRMANNQMTIDSHTIAFRDGGRVYVNNLSDGCGNLGGTRSLVLRNPMGSICRGQIAEVVDLALGAHVGGCVFGDFIPYTPMRG
jgi:hypothetical protein